jgi:ribosomal-protein-alanine N-acetyltransferase
MITTIRRFRLADLDRLLQIERQAFPKAAYPRHLFLELYEECAPLFFTAWRGRSMAGYAVTCTRPPRAELISIAVDRRYRRLGIAVALLRHTIARLRRAGVVRLNLMVRARNRGAIALYRDFGFRNKGRVPKYYENGEDGLRMSLSLDQARNLQAACTKKIVAVSRT